MIALTSRRRILAQLAAAAGTTGVARPSSAQDIRFFRIGTGGPTGTYFPIGGIIANAISNPPGSRPCEEGGSCGVPGLLAAAQSSNGSVDNVTAIGSGAIESGFSQADVAYWAYTGSSMFAEAGPVKNLRAIARLFRESVHLVTRADSGIGGIADLAGRRVSVDEEGSGTLVDARAILAAFGLGGDRVIELNLKPDRSAEALLAGEIDAFFTIAGYPMPVIETLAEDTAIALVPVNGPELDALVRAQPFFLRDFIPTEVYAGVGTVETLSVGALWVVAEAIEAELVHGITSALWHESTRKLLDEGHPKGKEIRVEFALQGVAIPLHPGAERYYQEVGLIGAL
ncbi:MAG: TAXI family TRAP transporter solute-binding subunit [Alphaproteobacteria bacterium]